MLMIMNSISFQNQSPPWEDHGISQLLKTQAIISQITNPRTDNSKIKIPNMKY